MEKISRKNLRKFMIAITMIMVIEMKEICECCIDSEKDGLLHIKSSFSPSSDKHLSSWGTSNVDCCTWERVHCNPTTGHITRLDFSKVTGFDFQDYWYMNASFFLPFQQLNQLDLWGNNIAGCIQNEGFERLSTLFNLEILGLRYNKFNNSILQSLSALPSLKSLDLSSNKLEGTINISELNNPTSTLQKLEFGGNQIKGFQTMEVELTNLEYLGLQQNRFKSSSLFSLRGLSSLKSLDLSDNYFEGTFNFTELNSLSNLKELDLSYNGIANFIVSKESNSLESLHLYRNLFNNRTTANFLQSIGKISSIKTLHLATCGLAGNIPTSGGLCHLKHLQHLDLQQNDLHGNLPRCLANLTFLRYLDLSDNQFIGDISVSPIQSLTSIKFLDLSYNLFEIPVSLSPLYNFSSLESLHAGNNTIYPDTDNNNLNPMFQLKVLSFYGYGEGGSLPKFLYHQYNLGSVVISNINLRGEFPYWLLQNNTRLWDLDLSENSLFGNLQLPNYPHIKLTYLDLSNNFLRGYIPSEIRVYFPNLKFFDISKNELKGTIPDSLCRSMQLYFLDISQNNISGTIPNCIGKLYQLEILDLSKNNILGSLPSSFRLSNLAVLNLSKNRLQGTLNPSVYFSSQLVLLDISHNNFSGRIPSGIEKIFNLGFLVLAYNNFEGTIPLGLCKLKLLSFLDLSHNSLNGHILSCLNTTSSWNVNQVYQIVQTLYITMKGHTYAYELKSLIQFSGIDISCNNLSGQIPDEIGDLKDIQLLNLSHNSLIGTIPTEFSNLKETESLDLSCNNLQGIIPPQLTQLFRLSAFNVSYNNLSGRTPNQVAQFGTFDEGSYRGNPFLCGWPLPKHCDESNAPPSNGTTSSYNEESCNSFIDMEFFYVSFGVTYAIVLLALVAVLCINPYWRRVWFYYVQKSIDKIM